MGDSRSAERVSYTTYNSGYNIPPVIHPYKYAKKCDDCNCRIDIPPVNHLYKCIYAKKCDDCKCRIDIPPVHHLYECSKHNLNTETRGYNPNLNKGTDGYNPNFGIMPARECHLNMSSTILQERLHNMKNKGH